jgi:hypothetical protein
LERPFTCAFGCGLNEPPTISTKTITTKESFMSNPTTTFPSRFGFHPCDRETFCKLKALKKYYWLTVRDFHRWWRWQRKLPQNRRGPEPEVCEVFVDNNPWRRPRRVHGQDAIRRYPKTLHDRGVLAWHAAARQPQAEPPPNFDVKTLAEIDRLFTEATNWFARS